MNLLSVNNQRKEVENLLQKRRNESLHETKARRALFDKRKEIVGKPTVMIWAFAFGALLGSKKRSKSASTVADLQKPAISTLSLLNTALATMALLRKAHIIGDQSSSEESNNQTLPGA